MKKILHILPISLFSFAIISCGGGEEDTDKSSDNSTTSTSGGTETDNSSNSTDNSSTSSDNTTTKHSAPTGLSASGSAGQVILDWTALSGASSYTVFWDNATGVSSSSTAITSLSTDNYTHSGLDNGATYYYKVAGVNSYGTGTLSYEVSASTPLPAPNNLTATSIFSSGFQKVILDWDNVTGAASYTVYWDNATGVTSSDTAITSISTDNYSHSGLDNSTTYYYKVAAVNSSGTGTLSSEASVTTNLNNALDFDGSNDHIVVSDHNSLDTDNSITISMWIRPISVANMEGLVSKRTPSKQSGNYALRFDNAEKLLWMVWGSGGSGTSGHVSSSSAISTGAWTHVAITFDNSDNTTKFYINGKLDKTDTSITTDLASNAQDIKIGYDGQNEYFQGKLDEVRIWSVVRSQAEIQANINTELLGTESNLVAYYKLNESSGTTAKDQTSNNNDGTLTNMDGSNDWVSGFEP